LAPAVRDSVRKRHTRYEVPLDSQTSATNATTILRMRATLGKNLPVRFTIAPSTATSATRESTPPSIVQANPPTCPPIDAVTRVPRDAGERCRRSSRPVNTPCAARSAPCAPSDHFGLRCANGRAQRTQDSASAGCSASSTPTRSRSAPSDRLRGVLRRSRSHDFPWSEHEGADYFRDLCDVGLPGELELHLAQPREV